MPIDEGVDLTRGLPYPDESFDLVVLTEVIEHLENHRAALSEVARVLRPADISILTTPNIMRLDSRLAFMLSGMHKAKRRQIPLDTPLDEAHHFHNYPIPFVLLYYLMRINGLRLERLGHGKVKPFSYVLYALFYPVVALDTRLRLIWRERKPPVRVAQPGACALDARQTRADGRQPDRARAQAGRSGRFAGSFARNSARNSDQSVLDHRRKREPRWPPPRGLIN